MAPIRIGIAVALDGSMTITRNYRTTKTTYGALRDGQIVFICGYRFRARNVRIASLAGIKTTMHGEPNRADVIRFEAEVVDDVDIKRTGYDGGTYGGYADLPILVMLPCERCGGEKPEGQSCPALITGVNNV